MNNTNDYVDVLMSFIHSKNDGYGLFNDRDQLVYCNDAYLDIMSINRSDVGKLCFEDILKINQATGRGIKVDSGNIDAFLIYVRSVRRSREYRLFEVDFVDGRWFIFSEQLNQNGYLLVHIKDITKQKVTQQTLQSSLSSYKYMALTDELTQVANRRSFVETVKTSLNNCENASVPMSLMIIDVDFFKSINDNFGHQIGDLVLKKLAQSLQQEIRPFDTIGRIGGEEFAIFLSNTTSDMAIRIAERLRHKIAGAPITTGLQSINCTVSIGVTTQDCLTSFEKLYEQADSALYQSKHSGRNKVTFEQSSNKQS